MLFVQTRPMISAAALLAVAGGAHGAVNAFEGFDTYSAGLFDASANGGSGWAADSAWVQAGGNGTDNDAFIVPSTPLSTAGGIAPGSQAVRIVGFNNDLALSRAVPASTAGAPAYFSYLFELPNDLDSFFAAGQIGGNTLGNVSSAFSIIVSDESVQARVGSSGGGSTSGSIATLVQGQTYLLVGRVSNSTDAGDGANQLDRLDVWVYGEGELPPAIEPAVGEGFAFSFEPGATVITKFNMRVANMSGGESFYFDAVRVADNWLAVVPEPASAVIALGGMLMLRRRSRAAG